MKFDIKTLCPNVVLNVAIITVIFLGILARLYAVKNGVGYIINDYQLIRQAINFSYFDILTKYYDDEQEIPILYIMLTKFLYYHFGLNHNILRAFQILCSCLALIFMPIAAFQICKNKYASLIAVSLLAFNHHILHYTQRVKHYPCDIFLSILLILFGYIFFSKPITKKKIIFFTITCIICTLFSYTAIIMISCLCFYYLFLFQKDNIKTKLINFLIFVIPWLIIFIPHVLLIIPHSIEVASYHFWIDPSASYIVDFGHLKELIFYLFGNEYFDGELPRLTISTGNWYLFVPIIAGVIIIFATKDRYLFSMLILPVFLAEILGILHIYPCNVERVSLWLMPIFMFLFILPIKYVKFNKQIISSLLSCIIIIYYLFIVDNSTINSIKAYFNGYNFPQNTVNIFMDELRKSDISAGDVIYIHSENSYPALFDVFDPKGDFKNNQIIDIHFIECEDCNDRILPKTLPENKNLYIYLYKDKYDEFDRENYELIKNNTNIIYEYETWFGDKFIKARKK